MYTHIRRKYRQGKHWATVTLCAAILVISWSQSFVVLLELPDQMDFQKAHGLSYLAELKWAALFFFESRGFPLATLPWMSCNSMLHLVVDACKFLSHRCYQRGLQLSTGDVWLAYTQFIILLVLLWWLFWWVSTSRQSCCHGEGLPFVNVFSYSRWMELGSLGDGLIALSYSFWAT